MHFYKPNLALINMSAINIHQSINVLGEIAVSTWQADRMATALCFSRYLHQNYHGKSVTSKIPHGDGETDSMFNLWLSTPQGTKPVK